MAAIQMYSNVANGFALTSNRGVSSAWVYDRPKAADPWRSTYLAISHCLRLSHNFSTQHPKPPSKDPSLQRSQARRRRRARELLRWLRFRSLLVNATVRLYRRTAQTLQHYLLRPGGAQLVQQPPDATPSSAKHSRGRAATTRSLHRPGRRLRLATFELSTRLLQALQPAVWLQCLQFWTDQLLPR